LFSIDLSSNPQAFADPWSIPAFWRGPLSNLTLWKQDDVWNQAILGNYYRSKKSISYMASKLLWMWLLRSVIYKIGLSGLPPASCREPKTGKAVQPRQPVA
jgi:hypothetical protein